MGGLFVIILYLILIGLVAGLAVFLLYRRKEPSSGVRRIGVLVGIATLGLLLGFGFMTWLDATIGAGFYLESYGNTSTGQEIYANYYTAMVRENFVRRILPPPWRPDCALGVEIVCQQINLQNQWRTAAHEWNSYLIHLSLGSVSAISAGLFTLFKTRRNYHKGIRNRYEPEY
jgi:hypothetical protein